MPSLEWTEPQQRRGRRVILLLLAVALISFIDLLITVVNLRSIGMIEANPIAAFLIESTRSWEALAAYKLLSVSVCVILLYSIRRYRRAEFAAWAALLILVMLSWRWHHYSENFGDASDVQLAQAGAFGDEWLVLD